MRRHPLDGVSLLFGTLFTLVGLAFAVTPVSVTADNLGWIVPIPLIAVGLVVVVAAARRGVAERRAYVPVEPASGAGTWTEPAPTPAGAGDWPEEPAPTPADAYIPSEPAGSGGPEGDPLGSPPPLQEE